MGQFECRRPTRNCGDWGAQPEPPLSTLSGHWIARIIRSDAGDHKRNRIALGSCYIVRIIVENAHFRHVRRFELSCDRVALIPELDLRTRFGQSSP